LAAAAVDRTGVAVLLDGIRHKVVGRLDHAMQLLVGEGAGRLSRVEAGGEAGLALEDVADAGYQVLVEQGVAE